MRGSAHSPRTNRTNSRSGLCKGGTSPNPISLMKITRVLPDPDTFVEAHNNNWCAFRRACSYALDDIMLSKGS